MNVEDAIMAIDGQIATLQKHKESLRLLGEKLVGFSEELNISTACGSVDIDNPTRTQVVKLLSHLKSGKWDKELSGDGQSVNYINRTFLPNTTLRIWGAEPPASCKVVMVDVEIPAQPARTEKRPKLVCKEDRR